MTNQKKQNTVEKNESFSSISAKSFLLVVAILCGMLALSGALSYFIPQGFFERDDTGAIINGSFQQGSIQGIAIWRIITAPIRVFFSDSALNIILISVFLLIMSGVFNLIEKTQGVKIIIGRTVKRFSDKKQLVICVTAFVFMLFGSFFGMFEELVTLLPLVIVLMLSMGFDTLTGVGVCMLAACFGFSAAITNPFSVGIASGLAGTSVSHGAWLRIVFFAVVYIAVCAFLLLHARKITKNPELSPTYQLDIEKRKRLDLTISSSLDKAQEDKIFRVYSIFFCAQIIFLILIASIRAISGLAIPLLSVTFLVGGILAGCLICENKKNVFKYFAQGATAMLPAVLMIALATSIKLVMDESCIMDTVMHAVIEFLKTKDKFVCVILIYFLILFLQLFIGSASAKLLLIMPIALPVCSALGISPNVVILTYCIADGFTDVILPTNPVLLIGLSMANISYGKWVKWTWKLQLGVFIFTIFLLLFAVQIGY